MTTCLVSPVVANACCYSSCEQRLVPPYVPRFVVKLPHALLVGAWYSGEANHATLVRSLLGTLWLLLGPAAEPCSRLLGCYCVLLLLMHSAMLLHEIKCMRAAAAALPLPLLLSCCSAVAAAAAAADHRPAYTTLQQTVMCRAQAEPPHISYIHAHTWMGLSQWHRTRCLKNARPR
jgi:hypothetical protein